jgi:hypothetical protein
MGSRTGRGQHPLSPWWGSEEGESWGVGWGGGWERDLEEEAAY